MYYNIKYVLISLKVMSRYNGCMNYKAYRYNGCIIFSFESDEYIFHSVVTYWIVMQTPPPPAMRLWF